MGGRGKNNHHHHQQQQHHQQQLYHQGIVGGFHVDDQHLHHHQQQQQIHHHQQQHHQQQQQPSALPPHREEEANVSWNDIKVVQNLIERCLQQFMTQQEIITALQLQAHIDPSFTCLVWQKLEEQNPEFFFSYACRLRLRDQIEAFNYLVDQQLHLMQKMSLNVGPGPSQQRGSAAMSAGVAAAVAANNAARSTGLHNHNSHTASLTSSSSAVVSTHEDFDHDDHVGFVATPGGSGTTANELMTGPIMSPRLENGDLLT